MFTEDQGWRATLRLETEWTGKLWRQSVSCSVLQA